MRFLSHDSAEEFCLSSAGYADWHPVMGAIEAINRLLWPV
jgi:hypothetical protein